MLKDIQSKYIRDNLSACYIDGANIYGIWPELTNRLIAEGIRTAGDIKKVSTARSDGRDIAFIHHSDGRRIYVYGIGPKKAQEISIWRQMLESQFRASVPKQLPDAQEASIRSKYQSERQYLTNQKNSIEKNSTNNKEDTMKSFEVQKQAIDGNINQVKEKLTDIQWHFERTKRELNAFHRVRFVTYLKQTIMWWKKV